MKKVLKNGPKFDVLSVKFDVERLSCKRHFQDLELIKNIKIVMYV